MGKESNGDEKAERLSKSDCCEQLELLQLQVNDVARWLQHIGKRLVVVVEGRDTAGERGVISSISQTLNPRQWHIVPLGKPSDAKRTQWYFQLRFATWAYPRYAYHDVLAPNAELRALVVPQEPEPAEAPEASEPPWPDAPLAEYEANCAHHRLVRLRWDRLLERVFEIDMEHCPNCGGELKISAAILRREAGRKRS